MVFFLPRKNQTIGKIMKNEKYLVRFATGQEEEVYAIGDQEAVILAKAQQIKKGNDWQKVTGLYIFKALPPVFGNAREKDYWRQIR